MKKTILLLFIALLVLSLPNPAVAAAPTPALLQSIPLCSTAYEPKFVGDFPEVGSLDGVIKTQVNLLNAGEFLVTATLTANTLVRVTGCTNGNQLGTDPNMFYQVSVTSGRFTGLSGWVQASAVTRK